MPKSKGFRLSCESSHADLTFEDFTIFALQSSAKASEQMIYAVCQVGPSLRSFLADLSLLDESDQTNQSKGQMEDDPEEATLSIKSADPAFLKVIQEHYKQHHFAGSGTAH